MKPDAVPCRNLVIHGTEATGKSSVTEQLLSRLSECIGSEAQNNDSDGGLLYATVNAAQCITGRHLFERTIGAVADALSALPAGSTPAPSRRCETLAQLTVALSSLLEAPAKRDARWRFVLVFDAIDRQRDAPPTLLPALGRLSEIVCYSLAAMAGVCLDLLTRGMSRYLVSPASSSSPHHQLAFSELRHPPTYTSSHTPRPSSCTSSL